MKDWPSRECLNCGSPCRAIPIRHGDGRVEVEGYYCERVGCEMRHRNQLRYGKPGVRETEFGADWSARYTAFGRPDQNEANTLPTCRTFVGVLRRDFALSIGEVEMLNPTEHPGVDARASWAPGSYLNMQVTRSLPDEDYEDQAFAGEIQRTRRATDAVHLLRGAIEKKTTRTREHADISGITLLIDGRAAIDLAFPAAPIIFDCAHGEWAQEQGWESIWVIGPSFATRLDRNQRGRLPPSWPSG
jgi:hypothetical protein